MMEAVTKSMQVAGEGTTPAQPEEAAVLRALDLVMASPPFRTSKQCQDLLRYVVEHSLRDDTGGLRERIVGVEVFGRAPDYDTGSDPVVRMRAADVRKRLAQYYQSSEFEGSPVYIELRPGSYRAGFRTELSPIAGPEVKASNPSAPAMLQALSELTIPEVLPAEQGSDGGRARSWVIWSLAGALLLVIVAGVVWRSRATHVDTAQRRFWAPLTQSGRPVLLYFGSNVAYTLRAGLLEKYQPNHGTIDTEQDFFPDFPKGSTISTDDLLPKANTFVTVGDLAATAQLVGLMSRWSTPFSLRFAQDVSMGDLRSTPTVLVGGFNNRWTLEMMKDLPFVFHDDRRIQSRTDPSHGWSLPAKNHGESTGDYALISRVLHADTGGPVVAVGGIQHYGTQAAAEFISSEEEMNKLLRNAPAGWQGKNMQVVLRIKVVDSAPVAVEVVETIYW